MSSLVTLEELVKVSDENRDENWENKFFQALSLGQLAVDMEEPQAGPDGWPYLFTKTSEASPEPFQKILHWLFDKGIGLVINPDKEYPDYIFTYGMLWHFKETGLFFKEVPKLPEGVFEFQVKDIKKAGDPGESFLPSYVRKVIKEFFNQQGVLAPKILSFTLDDVNYELAFSKESLGNPEDQETQGILEAVSWFLPPHYQLALISEKELPYPFVIL